MDENIKNGFSSLIQTFQVQKATIEQTIEQEVANEMQNRETNVIVPFQTKIVAKTNETIAMINDEKTKELQKVEEKYAKTCDSVRNEANITIDKKRTEEQTNVRIGVNARYKPQLDELSEQIDFLTKHIEK